MKQQTRNRWIIYLLGMCILSLGISMNSMTGLGVSPIISTAFCVSQIYGLNFGDMTFILYAILVLAQLVLRPRSEYVDTLLQLVVSLIVSRLLNFYDWIIPYESSEHSLVANLLFLAVAIFLTGLGIAMTVNMRLTLNPGDGIVQAIARKAGWSQGFAKNVFDISCVVVTCIMGLILAGHIVGIGLGTVLAMIGVGRAVSLSNWMFQEKMCRAAGMDRR